MLHVVLKKYLHRGSINAKKLLFFYQENMVKNFFFSLKENKDYAKRGFLDDQQVFLLG